MNTSHLQNHNTLPTLCNRHSSDDRYQTEQMTQRNYVTVNPKSLRSLMTLIVLIIGLVGISAAWQPLMAQTNLIQNGSFDGFTGNNMTPNGMKELPGGPGAANGISNWNPIPASHTGADIFSPNYFTTNYTWTASPDGGDFAHSGHFLFNDDIEVFGQSISGLQAGTEYELTFYQSTSYRTSSQSGDIARVEVNIDGQTFYSDAMNVPADDVTYPWESQSITFTATGNNTTLTFHADGSLTPGPHFNTDVAVVGVDGVSMEAVVSCDAGTTIPTRSPANESNSCPTATVDITDNVSSTPPTGTVVQWHTVGSNPSASTLVSNANAITTTGSYYPFYFDGTNDCYSPNGGGAVEVTITACACDVTVAGDCDNDGVDNLSDCDPNDVSITHKIGDSCDDGDANTDNDVWTSCSTCAGTIPFNCDLPSNNIYANYFQNPSMEDYICPSPLFSASGTIGNAAHWKTSLPNVGGQLMTNEVGQCVSNAPGTPPGWPATTALTNGAEGDAWLGMHNENNGNQIVEDVQNTLIEPIPPGTYTFAFDAGYVVGSSVWLGGGGSFDFFGITPGAADFSTVNLIGNSGPINNQLTNSNPDWQSYSITFTSTSSYDRIYMKAKGSNSYMYFDNFRMVYNLPQLTLSQASCEITVSNAGNLADVTSYDWFKDGVFEASTTSPSFSTQENGYYTVKGKTATNCYTVASSGVNVTAAPCTNTIMNTCPSVTVDLDALHQAPIPNNTNLIWSTDNDETDGITPIVMDGSAVDANGLYYAYYHDAANDCYSPGFGPVEVIIEECCVVEGMTPNIVLPSGN